MLVGGYPGAGVKTQVARSAKYMQERGFSVVRILTQSFFRPVSASQCPVCASFAKSYGGAAQATCRYCPESLHEDALLRSVNAAILRLTSASDFVEGVGRAIIYVLGINVMECCELMTAASGISWVNLEDEPNLCAIRYLRSKCLWYPDIGEDPGDPAVVEQIKMFRAKDNGAHACQRPRRYKFIAWRFRRVHASRRNIPRGERQQ